MHAKKDELKRYNTVMSVIPGGCTKYLQPLDVCINKPFKAFFRQLYDDWLRKGEFDYTSGGRIKVPSHKQQILWIVQAWKKVSKDVINSFDVCGITTNNVEKISCIQNLTSDSHTETTAADIDNVIDDDEVGMSIPLTNQS